MELAAVIIAGLALVVGIVVAIKQHEQGGKMEDLARDEGDISKRLLEIDEARQEAEQRAAQDVSAIERRLLEIEEARHSWELQGRQAEAERERAREEIARTAAFSVTFAYRDSARTRGRIVARNNGPADARDVSLELFTLGDPGRIDVEPMGGQDYRSSEVLVQGESVRMSVAFTMQMPGLEDMRYELKWADGRGPHIEERQVPIPD